MFGPKMRFFLILLAAVGIPYFWFDGHFGNVIKEKFHALIGSDSQTASASLLDDTAIASSDEMAYRAEDGQVDSLQAVLRFDVTPHWVTQRWHRVSTIHTTNDLEGLRVPLVTGTALDDLAGSLTYYFDHQSRVQRIDLHGHTGDERKLVAICNRQFGLQSEPNLGAGMYIARWNARPTSVLRVSFAPIVRADRPARRLEVALQLNRPNRYYGLSPDFSAMLTHEHDLKRW